MVVRELVALLGIDMDERSFEKADRGIEKLKQAATVLGTLFFTGAVARGMERLVQMASDVEETANVVDVAFADQAERVRAWASTTAGAVGRSEWTLQKFAAQIGAMTSPLMETSEATAQLSTDIALLAVDLSSFFNTTEADALIALKAGLVGETEPLRRYGVTLTQAALQEFALSRGIQKSVETMTESEKLQLRYQFIMMRTTQAQGDAVRTANSYANAARGLRERLVDLGTRIGNILLPGATRLVIWARDALNSFLAMARGTKILEVSLIALQGIFGAIAVKMILPFLPVLLTWGAIAAAIGLVILAAEDLYAFFTGRESIVGLAVDRLRERFPRLAHVLEQLGQIAGRVWDWTRAKAAEVADRLGPLFERAWEATKKAADKFLAWIEPKLQSLLELDVQGGLQKVADFFAGFSEKISAFLNSPLGKALMTALGAWLGKKLGVEAGSTVGEALGSLFASSKVPYAKQVGGWLGSKVGGLAGGLGGAIAGGVAAHNVMGDLFPGTATVPVSGGGAPKVDQTNQLSVSVNVQGTNATPAEIEAASRRGVEDVFDGILRSTQAAVTPWYAPAGTK